MTNKNNLFLFLKGAAMGAADVVPGVSGGTIAFISGIYEKLLASLNAINMDAVKLLASFRLKALWDHINGTFLLVLFAGIGTSILSLTRLILFLLENYPELLWAFFFGLIIGSVILIIPKISRKDAGVFIAGILGAAAALYITMATPSQTPEALWFILFSGALAICAMILPGISGSFILLILGKYEFILNSLKELKISVILTFGLGCVIGLLSFSRLLKFLLNKYHDLTVAVLTGFMLGSLNKVWPWKNTVETFTDRHGIEKPLIQENISPFIYEDLTGKPALLLPALALLLLGFLAVFALGKISEKQTSAV